MEVRLRAAAAPRTRPARDPRATSRSRARARGTRSRTHHRPPIARPTAKHCPLQPAPRTASHTIHARTHPPPAFGRRHPACRRDSKRLKHVHPVAQVKQRRTREAAAQQRQQPGGLALSEQAAHDMLQQLLIQDSARPVRPTPEQTRTLRARQRQQRRAQTRQKRAHEHGPHTDHTRLCKSQVKPPQSWTSLVNIICEYKSCNSKLKTVTKNQ